MANIVSVRRSTREVMVGQVGVGGNHPIRIQSMTTTNTRHVDATVEQIIRLADAGCEIVRMTVQGIAEADACSEIKEALLKRGYQTPLVADIHFFPAAALRVADAVDKIRINPGNFVDKRASFKQIVYDDKSYAIELEKIEEKFSPLVEKCKRLKRALRIGTNHGSLSDRIMSRYGDTPHGMVESALEFARICRQLDYHDLIFSMKSSNPHVMIEAYRLLAETLDAQGWDYPLHLGVTEAGEGEDGRIKSAMGIGTLLLEGLGDTIRVSLTEDPWHEIDPCQRLIRLSQSLLSQGGASSQLPRQPRRPVKHAPGLPTHRDGTVVVTLSAEDLTRTDLYSALGCRGTEVHPKADSMTADAVVLEDGLPEDRLLPCTAWGMGIWREGSSLISLAEEQQRQHEMRCSRSFQLYTESVPRIVQLSDESSEQWKILLVEPPALLIFSPSTSLLPRAHALFQWLRDHDLQIPVILHRRYDCSQEDAVLLASMEYGPLLCDGLGEGIWLEGPYSLEFRRRLSFAILQAARMRMSKTDFISCPSCGRTLFDLQQVTKRIQARTSHLPGVKIAIMGCIVNGPGEMADADFGYVGSKPGKIDLYVGKTCRERDIDFSEADERLVSLIKAEGRWKEPEEMK